MGQLLTFMSIAALAAIIVLPWALIVMAPVVLFTALAVTAVALSYKWLFDLQWEGIPYVNEITRLEKVLLNQMHQWPEAIHVFARKTEKLGNVTLMIEYSSSSAKWNTYTHSHSLHDAISKMTGALVVGPVPPERARCRAFAAAPQLPPSRNFLELFPFGLHS